MEKYKTGDKIKLIPLYKAKEMRCFVKICDEMEKYFGKIVHFDIYFVEHFFIKETSFVFHLDWIENKIVELPEKLFKF